MTYYEQMHIAALERIATALEYIVERDKKYEAERKNYEPVDYTELNKKTFGTGFEEEEHE